MKDKVFQLIRNCAPELPAAQRVIADFVLVEPETVTSMTIEQLAERCDTSVATISRFCRRLSFSSFQDFKLQLAAGVTSRAEKDRRMSEIYRGDVLASAQQIIDNHIRHETNTLRYLSEENIGKAAELMASAGKILFLGAPETLLTSMLVCGKFMHSTDNAICFPDAHMQQIGIKSLSSGDVALIITDGHESEYVQQLTELIQYTGAAIISIFPIANIEERTLSLSNSTMSFELEDMFSAGETVLNFIIDVLLVEFIKRLNEQTETDQ